VGVTFARPSAQAGSAGEQRIASPGANPHARIEIQPKGACHVAVTRLYPPLARKRDRDRRCGAARPLLSSVVFGRFRAPIDSVMDPGGQPRQPSDPFLSLRYGFGLAEKIEG
jgi:hypothetical protein